MGDKSQRAAIYRAFISREGPQSLGSVSWPTPKRGALKGQKLLSTGVLETIEREDLNKLLADSSAHVMSTMSKKLDILIVGRDAGPKKLQNADEWGVRQMGEAEFHSWITDRLDQYIELSDGGAEDHNPPARKTPVKRSQSKVAPDEPEKKKESKKAKK